MSISNLLLLQIGWEERIRTSVAGARIQSPATRRLPNGMFIKFVKKFVCLQEKFRSLQWKIRFGGSERKF
jgi:hypothetical protein